MDNNMNNNINNNGMYMNDNMQNMGYSKPKKPLDVWGLVAIITGSISFIFAILGTTLTCACSASKTYSKKNFTLTDKYVIDHQMSAVFILSIFAIIFAITSVVFAVIAIKKNRKSIMGITAAIIGLVSFIYAFIPMLTICSYNCSVESAIEKENEKAKDKSETKNDSGFDYNFDDFFNNDNNDSGSDWGWG